MWSGSMVKHGNNVISPKIIQIQLKWLRNFGPKAVSAILVAVAVA